MTRIRWYMSGTAIAARAACVVLLAGMAGTVAAAEAASDYAQLMEDADSLRRYNGQLRQLLESQVAQIASIEAQIAGLDGTAAAVQPLLRRMFDSLQEFVAGDLPFLVEERTDRIDRLRELMASDGAIGEKFRRLMEAYRIELEYGRTMAAYRGRLDDGRKAEFVHLGRVTLLYRTIDGTETGYWDAASGAWVADAGYARAISDALAMANEEVAPDLVTVPVPATAETSS